MTVPGIVLSQPLSAMTASKRCPRLTSSIESATTSRLTRLVFMPLVPIVMPSEIAIVLNSIGVPPAARMPSLTFAASARRWKLQGIVSIHVEATPMIGLARSSVVKPMPFKYARAGARAGPSVRARELCLGSSGVTHRTLGVRRALHPGVAAAGALALPLAQAPEVALDLPGIDLTPRKVHV